MRKIFFGALVALSMLIANAAIAGSGHKMAENHTPATLADAIEHSLVVDPSGGGIIPGTACTQPVHYWEAIEEANDDIRFNSFTDMISFIRSLVRMENASIEYPGSYSMARTLGKIGGDCDLDMIGYSRGFRTGENVWMDPRTGKPILAEDCANVVRIPDRVVVVPPAPPLPPIPEEPACIPMPKGQWNIAFPNAKDIAAWKECNPEARCAPDCEDWLLYGNRDDPSTGRLYSNKVQAATGQGSGSGVLALKGYNLMMPVQMSGPTVLCREGGRAQFWHLDASGEVYNDFP